MAITATYTPTEGNTTPLEGVYINMGYCKPNRIHRTRKVFVAFAHVWTSQMSHDANEMPIAYLTVDVGMRDNTLMAEEQCYNALKQQTYLTNIIDV